MAQLVYTVYDIMTFCSKDEEEYLAVSQNLCLPEPSCEHSRTQKTGAFGSLTSPDTFLY